MLNTIQLTGKAVFRNTCAYGILVNKSITYTWFLKSPLYYKNKW